MARLEVRLRGRAKWLGRGSSPLLTAWETCQLDDDDGGIDGGWGGGGGGEHSEQTGK